MYSGGATTSLILEGVGQMMKQPGREHKLSIKRGLRTSSVQVKTRRLIQEMWIQNLSSLDRICVVGVICGHRLTPQRVELRCNS